MLAVIQYRNQNHLTEMFDTHLLNATLSKTHTNLIKPIQLLVGD